MNGEADDRRPSAPASVAAGDLTIAALAHRCPTCGQCFSGDAKFCPFDGDPLDVALDYRPKADPLVGQVVDGRYDIEAVLGQGGMGTVYAARHRALGKRFALKVMRADLARQGNLAARFIQEARAAALIGHPNVVQITDFGQTPAGQPYFVMELLEGTPLSKLLRKGGPPPIAISVRILEQVARGLAAAHAAGVIHRDLKPDNIQVTGESSVKILDFGVAKVAGAGRLTRTGMVFGTPHYMSPEQASGGPIDQRADIYALGIIMYEMFTGRVPFEADSYMGVLTKHMFMRPEPLGRVYEPARQLGALESITFKCLEKNPAERYASMQELIRDVENLLQVGGEKRELVPASRGASQRPVLLAGELDVPADEELELPLLAAGVPKKMPGFAVALAVLILAVASAIILVAWTRSSHAPSRSQERGKTDALPVSVAPVAALPSCAASALVAGSCVAPPATQAIVTDPAVPSSTARTDARAASPRKGDAHGGTSREPRPGRVARPAPGAADIVNPWAK